MKIPFDGYDFTILGLAMAFGAGILFAKAYLVPSFPAESAQTFFDSNPFLVRGGIVTRHEAIAGIVWLAVGSILTLVGIVRTVQGDAVGSLYNSWFDILVLLAAVLVLGRLTVAVTDRTSRAEYLPIMSTMMQELYTRDSHCVFHDGLSVEDSQHGWIPSETEREGRLSAAGRNLDTLGKLLDEPRRDSETDEGYARRLASYFPDASVGR